MGLVLELADELAVVAVGDAEENGLIGIGADETYGSINETEVATGTVGATEAAND